MARYARRVLVAVLTLGLVALLMLLLFQPFWHPRTHLYVLAPSAYQSDAMPPIDYVAEDVAALKSVERAFSRDIGQPTAVHVQDLATPDSADEFSSIWESQDVGIRDVLVVYVVANAMAEDGRVYLLCGDADPADSRKGRYSLASLLRRVGDSPAAVKLVVLDTRAVLDGPRTGMLANQVPRLIGQQVRATRDPGLWVLTSNSSLERAHVCRARQRSVFGYYLTEAMRGGADLDENQVVDLHELFQYVAVHVAAWVEHHGAGAVTQTPTLVCGSDRAPTRRDYPTLFSVAALSSESDESAPADSEKSAEERLRSSAEMAGFHVKSSDQFAAETKRGMTPSGGPGAQAVSATGKINADDEKNGGTQPDETQSPADDEASATPAEDAGQPNDDGPNGVELPGDGSGTAADGTTEGKEQGQSVDSELGSATAASGASSIPALLSEGWKWRDRLADPAGYPNRPVDYAPHLWRAVEQRLFSFERRYRAGALGDEREMAKNLSRLVEQTRDLALDRPPRSYGKEDLVPRLAGLARNAAPRVEHPHSVALAELMAELGGPPLDQEVLAAIQKFDFLVGRGDHAAFAEWIAQLPPEYDRYTEFRAARTLAERSEIAWPHIQLALRTRRFAEQVAATSLEGSFWLQPQIEKADGLRLAGERCLHDGIGPDSDTHAARLLAESLRVYGEAAQAIQDVKAARSLHNDVLFRVPYYLRWGFASESKGRRGAPREEDLVRLVETLGELSAVLLSPEPKAISQVRQFERRLATLRGKIEAGLSQQEIESLVTGPAKTGAAWRIEALLDTPLAGALERSRLIGAAEAVERQVGDLYHAPSVHSATTPLRKPTDNDWERLEQQAELHSNLAHFVLVGEPASGRAAEAIREACTGIPLARDRQAAKADAGRQPDHVWDAHARLGELLKGVYEELPTCVEYHTAQNLDLSDPQSRGHRLRALREARKGLYLVHPHDAVRIEQYDPVPALRQAELYELLVWHQKRYLMAVDDAPPSELAYLLNSVEACASAALAIPNQPPILAPSRPPMALDSVEALNLTIERATEFPLSIRNLAAEKTDVWLLLLYDPELIEVTADIDHVVYHEAALRRSDMSQTAEADLRPLPTTVAVEPIVGGQYPFRPDCGSCQPTAKLQPGQTETIVLRVSRKRPSAGNARLVVKAITSDAYVRHETIVRMPALPTVDVLVRGPSGAWTPSAEGVVLHPYPNRVTEFQLLLASTSGREKNIDIHLLSAAQAPLAALPQAELSADESDEVLSRYSPTTSLARLADIRLPANGDPVALPFPEPPEEEAAAKDGDAGAESPMPTAIAANLLMVLTDRATQQTTIKRLEVAPQRPARYVRPQVGYNLEQERVEIRVTPVDKGAVPPEGIEIKAEFVTALTSDAESRLEGTIEAPSFAASLYAEVPEGADREATVYLHVDEFPRAFVYRVPCDAHSLDIPPEEDLVAVRITDLPDGTVFGVPSGPIPVELQVDVPRGAFRNSDNIVEVGIDADRDRELQNEVPVVLRSDREVALALGGVRPDGWLALEARVGDFRLDVPSPSLRNAKANMLARVICDETESWSEPIELTFDAAPPKLWQVELMPDRVVVAGAELEMSVLASDGELSGVAKVEAAFDRERKGEFGGETVPVAAAPSADGRWTAKLPTAGLEPRRYTLLVRATDIVENSSDYTKVKVEVISKEQAEARKAAITNRVTGRVVYGRLAKVPVAEIRVQLKPVGEGRTLTTATDTYGGFSFPEVSPGDYVLTAEGNVRGNRKIGKVEVAVAPPPGQIEPIEVVIDTPR